MSNNEPVAVPLHGASVVSARPAASNMTKTRFHHSAPHLTDAMTRPVVPASEDAYENTPDFAPTSAPTPRGL